MYFLRSVPYEGQRRFDSKFLPRMERLANDSLGPGFKEAQWYLLLFGVAPEFHRKGVAKAMMKVAEERVSTGCSIYYFLTTLTFGKAKADRVSIVLETATQVDVRANADDSQLCGTYGQVHRS